MPQEVNSPYYTNWLKAGMIYPYVQTIYVYKCPVNQLHVNPPGTLGPMQIRTYSVNGFMGAIDFYSGTDWGYLRYYKMSQIMRPGPSTTWVFTEENPYSIDDAFFAINPSQTANWVNAPAVYHGNSSVLSFADGHSESHKWHDSNMITAKGSNFAASSGSGDLAWFNSITTALR